jgi:endonuclease I
MKASEARELVKRASSRRERIAYETTISAARVAAENGETSERAYGLSGLSAAAQERVIAKLEALGYRVRRSNNLRSETSISWSEP